MPRPPARIPARSQTATSPRALQGHLSDTSQELLDALRAVLEALPESAAGPQELARSLSLDKVLTSRLLKAARTQEPLALAYHVPGPEPVRRFLRAAKRRGVPAEDIRKAERAVESFRALVREEVGDRSALDAVLSSWLPEARREFEARRKQSAFRAISELRGIAADTTLATVMLHPSAEDEERIDVLWLTGMLGIRRLRPGARAKLSTRRFVQNGGGRSPQTLDGDPVEDLDGLRLDHFCHARPAEVEVRGAGESMHYLLGGEEFGARAVSDLLLAEVNTAEMPRSPGSDRKGYVFAEIATPTRALIFDTLVHESVYPGAFPELHVYDTSLEGVADVNDPARDIDRLDMSENVQHLGTGLNAVRSTDVPDYIPLLEHVHERMGWDPSEFHVWRCRIEYPLHGAQVAMAFDPRG
jgi:hypothetical protein